MKSSIIGAKGEMAQNLLLPILKQLGLVLEVDKESSVEDLAKIWEADVIWLAVPRDTVDDILKDVHLDSNKLIIDICSIKRNLSSVIALTGANFLSLHPLHGSYVPLNGQKWAIIKRPKGYPEFLENNKNAEEIIEFLKKQGISFIEAQSEDEHDFMMGITLGIPEFLTIIIDELINTYTKENNQEKPDMRKIMEWAVPASNAFFSAYVHSINSSAGWLRKDLVLGSYGNLIESAKKTAEDISKISSKDVEEKLAKQKEFVDGLPLEERKRIRQWIDNWFVDSTQKIFSFHQKKSVKPRLKIQFKLDNNQEIFPTDKSRVSVGIHGIEGCFTHESALRICEDLGIDSSKIDFKYLIDANGVIGAVDRGEIDRGIFCVANSGSGAYIDSMKMMGEYNFDVLALYGMEIMQCLMARPEMKDISEIKEIFAHPQAISQCERTFAEKYPEIKLIKGTDADDTALCAKRIANNEFPKTTATLASQIAARLYGLNILEYGMHHDPFNTTTMLVIKKKNENKN
jgi:prephenate dehydratase/prephenate dehydrogenase